MVFSAASECATATNYLRTRWWSRAAGDAKQPRYQIADIRHVRFLLRIAIGIGFPGTIRRGTTRKTKQPTEHIADIGYIGFTIGVIIRVAAFTLAATEIADTITIAIPLSRIGDTRTIVAIIQNSVVVLISVLVDIGSTGAPTARIVGEGTHKYIKRSAGG